MDLVSVPFRGISFPNVVKKTSQKWRKVSVPFRGISFPNRGVCHRRERRYQFPSPSGASHFQILSFTPRIPCGLAERLAWENQIGASFMSSASPKTPQTQHLSHARENRPPLPLSLISHSHYNTRFIITQSLFSSTQLPPGSSYHRTLQLRQ